MDAWQAGDIRLTPAALPVWDGNGVLYDHRKANPYHDEQGRFAEGPGGGASGEVNTATAETDADGWSKQPLYHGSGATLTDASLNKPLYLTGVPGEAAGFAQGLHLGGTAGDARVYGIKFKPGYTVDINAQIEDAMMNDEDIDDAIQSAIRQNYRSFGGARFLTFTHPGFQGDDFKAVIALHPDKDLKIVGSKPAKKFNEHHDDKGRFASAAGAGAEEIPVANLSEADLATMHMRTELYHTRGLTRELDPDQERHMTPQQKDAHQAAVQEQHRREKAFVEHVAQTLDFPADRVEVSYEPKTFMLNGTERLYAGSFSPDTGKITVWPDEWSSYSAMQNSIAHEVMHARYDKFMSQARAEDDAVQAAKEAANFGPNSPTYPTGEIKPEFESKYPLYSAVYGGGDGRGRLTGNLAEEDGITTYSRDWWKAAADNPRLEQSAINETLAEIAATEYSLEGGSPFRYTGTTPGSEVPIHAPSDNWGKLYNLVNSRWKT